MVLLPNPQFSGSLSAPSIQVPLKELAGRAQLVKSALICVSALLLGFVQRSLLATINASLSALSAQDDAQIGRELTGERPHGWTEFCTMALHSTLVVKRA